MQSVTSKDRVLAAPEIALLAANSMSKAKGIMLCIGNENSLRLWPYKALKGLVRLLRAL